MKFYILSLVTGFLVFLNMHISADSLNIANKVSDMEKKGQQQTVGKADNTGLYIICIEEVSLSDGMNAGEAGEMALANAKKAVAAMFGTQVTSQETSSSTTVITQKSTDKGSESTAESTDITKEFTQIDINQLLKGFIIYSSKKDGDKAQVVCVVTEKTISAATELKKKMEELGPDTVEAIGIAFITENRIDLAKNQAKQSAMRSAVEQVLGTVLSSTTQVRNDQIKARIFAGSVGFIDKYRVIEEGAIPDGYRVVIVATVSKTKLMDSYASLMKSLGDPQFFLNTDNNELRDTFIQFFSDLGFKLVDNKDKADYIIDAEGTFRQLKHPIEKTDGVQLSLWIKIKDAKSGQELMSQKNDPKKSAVFYSSDDRQKDIAVEKAFAQMKDPLHEELNKLIIKMASTGREVQVLVDNYSSAKDNAIEKIYKAIEMVPGCSNVNKRIDSETQTVIFTANYQGKMDDFESFLSSSMQKDITDSNMIPKTKAISANMLELNY